MTRSYRRTLGPVLLALGMVGGACSGDGEPEEAGTAGTGGRTPGNVTPGTGGSSGTGGSEAGGSATGGTTGGSGGGTSGAGATAGASGGAGSVSGGCGDPELDPDFPGIDTSCVPENAPAGCEGGLNLQQHALNLTLTAPDTTLLLSVSNGEVRANGVTCSAADNTPATVDNVHTITVEGTDADDTVIIDQSHGSLGPNLLSLEGAIFLNLQGASNTLALRGTSGDDHFAAWRFEDTSVIALTPESIKNIQVDALSTIVLSFGTGDDILESVEDDGEYDTGPLSVRLVAYGGAGDDQISGGTGDDFLAGGEGNDTLNGASGRDWFESSNADGTDVMNGGPGSDTVTYAARSSGVQLSMCASPSDTACSPQDCSCEANDGEDGEADTLVNVENAHGTKFADEMTGNDLDNTFYAYEGDDALIGGAGNDYLFGDVGDDMLVGGLGDDYLDGADGVDMFDGGEGSGDICLVESSEKPTLCELH